MKKVFFVLVLLLIAYPVMGAEISCESAKIYKVCGANIEGRNLYTITTGNCNKINHIGYFYRSFDEVQDVVNIQNASAYSSCETDREVKKSNKEIDEAKWFEIQLD